MAGWVPGGLCRAPVPCQAGVLAELPGLPVYPYRASLRDALCYLYCWGSAMRGKEAGKLELSDLYRDRDGKVPVDFPLPLVLPAGTQFVVCCHGSKTMRRQLCDPVLFTSGGPHTLDFVARLTFYT